MRARWEPHPDGGLVLRGQDGDRVLGQVHIDPTGGQPWAEVLCDDLSNARPGQIVGGETVEEVADLVERRLVLLAHDLVASLI